MSNAHCRTWIIARKQKNMENETQTVYDLKYGKQHSNTWKMRNAQSRTWSMVRNVKIIENEKNKLQDMKYGEDTEKCEKRETHCTT